MDAKEEMVILTGQPIKILMFGKEIEVKKLTIAKQQAAIALIEKLSSERGKKSAMEFSFELMSSLIELATGITAVEISESGDMIDVAAAFKKIWKQNRFDFLLKTMTELGNDLNGTPTTK